MDRIHDLLIKPIQEAQLHSTILVSSHTPVKRYQHRRMTLHLVTAMYQ